MPETIIQSLAAELSEYIAQRIREVSPGRVTTRYMLVIYPEGKGPPIIRGTWDHKEGKPLT